MKNMKAMWIVVLTILSFVVNQGLAINQAEKFFFEENLRDQTNEKILSIYEGKYELSLTNLQSNKPGVQLVKVLSNGKNGFIRVPAFETLKTTSPFIVLADGKQNRPPISNGNYQVDYSIERVTNSMTLNKLVRKDQNIEILGDLLHCTEEVKPVCDNIGNFTFSFTIPNPNEFVTLFSIDISSNYNFNEIHTLLSFDSEPEESFHGFGESFTYFNLKGKNVPILVSEQGVGRDEQPITDYLNQAVGEGVGGHWYTTYAPKPLFLTNYNRSLGLDISETSYFDLRVPNQITIDIWNDQKQKISGRWMHSDSLLSLLKLVTNFTGRQKILPTWTQEGAILGLEGGTENVTEIVSKLLAHDVPIVGVWLQDWVGLRHSWDGDRLIWNWELNNDYYTNWNEMISEWRNNHNIRVLTYLNPFFSDPTNFTDPNERRHNFFQEGIENNYFVMKSDGNPYLMYSLSIEFATLDFTNPAARRWMKDIIINQTLIEASSSGWMCDFGEYLPFDAVMHDVSIL
jgi:alpha-glucosidase (family GH31 glycosyl hydrolase)